MSHTWARLTPPHGHQVERSRFRDTMATWIGVAVIGSWAMAQGLPAIDPNSWPASGPATVASTGLDSITPGAMQHIALTGADGLIVDNLAITRALQSGSNISTTIRLTPLAGSSSLFGDQSPVMIDQAGVAILVRAVRAIDPPFAAPAPVVPTEGIFHTADLPSAGVSLRGPVRLVAVGPEIAPFDSPSLQVPQSGLTFFTRTGVTFPGGQQANPADEALLQAGRDPVIGEFVIKPVMGFDQWAMVWVHVHRGTRDAQGNLLPNTGVYSIGVNQQLISRRRGLNLAAASLAELNSVGQLQLPALPGMVWQVTQPRAFRGEDWGFARTIEHGQYAQRDLAWHWPMRFVSATLAPEAGVPWQVSGTGSWQVDAYARERLQPWRHRLIATLEPGQTLAVTSNQSIGRPAFNADGWSTLIWPMLRPGGEIINVSGVPVGSGSIDLLLASDDSQIPPRRLVSLDRLGLRYQDASGIEQRVSLSGADDRYALAIHMHTSGQAALTLINVSALHDESPTPLPMTWSMQIAPIPQPTAGAGLGSITMRLASHAASTALVISETDGLANYRTLTLAAADSYVSAITGNGLLPAYFMAENNSTRPYACLEDVYSATGFSPFFAPARVNPFSQTNRGGLVTPQGWSFAAVLGRPGRTLASWGPRFLAGLSQTRGTRIVLFGGIANDTARALNPALTQSAITGGEAVLSQIAAWPAQTQGHVTWIEPLYGTGFNFTTPGGREVFDALLAHGREVFCQTAASQPGRISIARMDPVSFSDGVHVGVDQESRAAMNVLRSLTDRPLCGFTPCGIADFGSEGGLAESDGLLNNDDFIVFIQAFFDEDPAADLGSEGGVVGGDSLLDNNDFIVFVDAFFTGC